MSRLLRVSAAVPVAALLGLILLACGIIYMAFFGHKLLPNRKSGTLTEAYQVKEYITEVEILEGSPLHGKSISQSLVFKV